VRASEPANDTPPDEIAPEPDPSEGKSPQAARSGYREGEALIKQGRYQEGIQALSKVIETYPRFPRAYSARGNAYLHLNLVPEAFADYNDLVRMNPKNAQALAQRGICHARLHDEDAALADFNKALEMRPGIPGALNGRGLVYLHRKQFQKAIQDFTEAIQASPQFFFAYANRAQAEEAAGNHRAAQADLAKAKELGFVPK
jgi:tetratricopeptide (TPR) repeat protein